MCFFFYSMVHGLHNAVHRPKEPPRFHETSSSYKRPASPPQIFYGSWTPIFGKRKCRLFTVRWNPRAPRASRTHHSYTDFKQSSWNLVCGILCLKPNTKQNFSCWGSTFWVMANFPWFFGHFEDSFLLSLFVWFFSHIWPYLWNYWYNCTEILCENRFWTSGGTH